MKRISTIALAALVSGAIFTNSPALAQNVPLDEMTPILIKDTSTQLEFSDFIKYSAVVSEVEQNGEKITLSFKDSEDSVEMILTVTDEVLLFNSGTTEPIEKDKLQKGQTIEAYYDKNKPMIMIYPPRIVPEILIVHDDKNTNQVKVAKFDENLVSLDNELKLKIDKDTVLLNQKGEAITEKDLSDKELIVFYDISTKSIPAQTAPNKVITYEFPDQQIEEIFQMINEDFYMKNETKMIPIRKVAEHLGYEVNWQEKTSSVLINKQNLSFLITKDNIEYGYNLSLQKFVVAPELKNNILYAPEEFIEKLLGK